MAINTRNLTGQELLTEELPIINSNFKILEEAVNRIESFVDPIRKEISVDVIFCGEEAILPTAGGKVRLVVYGNSKIFGNLTVNENISAKSVSVIESLEVKNGVFALTGVNSQLNVEGNVHIGGEIVLTEFSENYVPANSRVFFTAPGMQIVSYPTEGMTEGGLYSPTGRSLVVFDWSLYDIEDSISNLNIVYLDKTGVLPGHVLKIFSNIGSNTGYDFFVRNVNGIPFYIEDSIEYKTIKFTESDQYVELIYNGTKWLIGSYRGIVIE